MLAMGKELNSWLLSFGKIYDKMPFVLGKYMIR